MESTIRPPNVRRSPAPAAARERRGRRRVQRLVSQRGWGYSTPMRLAIELPPAQADKLRAEAERLGLSAEELARAALTDLLSTPDPEFQDVARRVVTKNQDLYKRLA